MDSKDVDKDKRRIDVVWNDDAKAGIISRVFYFPFNLFVNILLQIANGFIYLTSSSIRLIKPFGPILIPVVIFALAIPILVFLSISAGWFVWRSVAVGWEVTLYLQYGDGPPPYAIVDIPDIQAMQPYDISLHLDVPVIDNNVALGNFMSTLTLLTPANKTLATIRRPAIVLPPSSWSPSSFVFRSHPMIKLDITMLYSFQSTSSNVIAHVEVGRQDYWRSIGKGEGRELSVSSALLRGVLVHKGLRGIMTRYPLITALGSSAVFLSVSLLALGLAVLSSVEFRLYTDKEEGVSEDESAEKPRRRIRPSKAESADRLETSRRSRAARRSRSAATPRRSYSYEFKAEDVPVNIPSASSATTPLRRRRPRLSHQSEQE